MIKIKGLTQFYLSTLADSGHPLNGLVSVLSALDPVFTGKHFLYEPQDEDLFYSMVNLSTVSPPSQQ